MKKQRPSAKGPNFFNEWHPTKNGDLRPENLSLGSNKKVWWKCPVADDHEWQAMVIKRKRGNGCPFCSGHKVAKSNSLGVLSPKIAKDWHPTKNGALTSFHVSTGSGKKVWWQCPKDASHEWEAFINNRRKGSGCPICKNKKTIKANSLGALNSQLAQEWHPFKNKSLTAFDVTPGSNKKVWWQCKKSKNHEWLTYVSLRTRGTGCPHCGFSTSRPELRIFAELRTIFPSLGHRANVNGHEVDIYIPEINFGIEYDGEYWHRGKTKNDIKKNEALRKHLFLLRVREKGLPKISPHDIVMNDRDISLKLVKSILKNLLSASDAIDAEIIKKVAIYLERMDWAAPDAYKKLLAEKSHVTFENSISHLYPAIAKQWHPTKNQPLLPFNFIPGSHEKVWWKCSKGADHVWKTSIESRTKGGGCPICSNQKVVSSNSLATLNPDLASEWNYEKNKGVTPDDVGLGSNKKFWWKCTKGDDHEWRASVNRRQGCPICSNRKAVVTNCLSTLNPVLARQWHPTNNGNLTPFDLTPGSNKIVWWKCSKGADHEWKASIISRSKGHGCPICSNQKIVASNSLSAVDPKLSKQWHPTKNGKLTPKDIAPNTAKKFWWLGKCGHEFVSSVNNRRNGRDCPRCKHKRAYKTRKKNRENKDQLVLGDILK